MGLVRFVTTTGAGYSGIPSKDKDTLYFISDERRIYKGEVPYSGGIFTTVAEFPETGEVNTLYVNSATGEVRYYNGTSYQTVVPATGKSITGKGDGSLATTAAVAAYVTSHIGDLNVSALKGRVDTLEREMDTAQGQITTINGEGDGSIKKAASDAVASAKSYTNTVAAGKANTAHTHKMADVTGLSDALAGKANTKHTHTIADVTDLQTALNGKADATAIAAEKTRAEDAERANAQAIANEVTRAKETEKANADAIAANASSIADTRAWGRLDTSKKALIFGDSIARGFGTSNPGHTSWGNKLCDKLGITSYNFAVDGASFAINIFDQMATAHASTEFDDSEIGYVFMSGGINDHGRSYDSISTGISKTFNNISTYWPNAKVLFLPLLCAAKPLDSIDQGDQQYLHSYSGMYLLDICHTMFYRNVTVISDGYTWLQGYPEAAADQVHPNDTGANIIANNAYSLLKFGYLPPKLIVGSANWSEKFAAAIKADNSYNFYAMNDRMYKINGKVMFSDVSKLSTGDTIMQLPIQFSGRRDEVHIIMFYNMMSDATDNFKAFIVNGEMKLWTVPSITNTDYYFDYYGIVGVS